MQSGKIKSHRLADQALPASEQYTRHTKRLLLQPESMLRTMFLNRRSVHLPSYSYLS